jgi:hypothetical protein
MKRQFHQDPTEFFSVVGAPYLRESSGRDDFGQAGAVAGERRTDDQRPRRLEIGLAAICTVFCAGALGILLVMSDATSRLIELAYRAVN